MQGYCALNPPAPWQSRLRVYAFCKYLAGSGNVWPLSPLICFGVARACVRRVGRYVSIRLLAYRRTIGQGGESLHAECFCTKTMANAIVIGAAGLTSSLNLRITIVIFDSPRG